jgi:hypothetical protein
MPTVLDALEHAKWLVEHGRGQEPCVLVLPRIEAQKRKANNEKKTRIAFDADEQTYSDFHAERQRYIEACGNHPLIAYAIMIRLLRQLPDDSIRKLAEDDEPIHETVGDA